jgi:hypothetical protein
MGRKRKEKKKTMGGFGIFFGAWNRKPLKIEHATCKNQEPYKFIPEQ